MFRSGFGYVITGLALLVVSVVSRADPPVSPGQTQTLNGKTGVVVSAYGTSVPYATGYATSKSEVDFRDGIKSDLQSIQKQLAEIREHLGIKAKASREDQRAQVLVRSCVRCHTAPTGKGGVNLANKEGQLLEPDERRYTEIRNAILNGTMPKNGPPLPQNEKELFD
jgi:hypothetical protein